MAQNYLLDTSNRDTSAKIFIDDKNAFKSSLWQSLSSPRRKLLHLVTPALILRMNALSTKTRSLCLKHFTPFGYL